jgi:hypothetical protein
MWFSGAVSGSRHGSNKAGKKQLKKQEQVHLSDEVVVYLRSTSMNHFF